MAPSIYGHDDIKKAVACLLFGGARKVKVAAFSAPLAAMHVQLVHYFIHPTHQTLSSTTGLTNCTSWERASNLCHVHPIFAVRIQALSCACTQVMPDGTARRGDIHVLLIGDPSTAKSQFLKFAAQMVSCSHSVSLCPFRKRHVALSSMSSEPVLCSASTFAAHLQAQQQ